MTLTHRWWKPDQVDSEEVVVVEWGVHPVETMEIMDGVVAAIGI